MNDTDTGIRCGHCTGRHPTVADVRACAQFHNEPNSAFETVTDEQYHGTQSPASRGVEPDASAKQMDFLRSLVAERPGVATDPTGKWTKREASAEITRLLAMPRSAEATKAADDTPDVPAGRYAVGGADGVLRFYLVDRPTEGRWAGRTFLSVMASEEKHPVKSPSMRNLILKAIAVDPKAASLLYGKEIGHCGVCGRKLTDTDSRAKGIGPICAARMEW